MRPSAPVIATPNWLVSRDPLGRQRGDPVVGLVELAHRGEVDVGERVAGDDQEGVAEEVGGVADAARGAEQLLLAAVGELDAELRAVAEVALDQSPGTSAGWRSPR